MARDITLPAVVLGPADLSRLKRQLDSFHEQQYQAELRKTKVDHGQQAGKLLYDIAAANRCDLMDADQRVELLTGIERLQRSAPVVTLSFAVDPSAEFMVKLVSWLRKEVHPQVLVRIGLQPNIAAGCILRTPSKIYDFSLRGKFADQRQLLINRIRPDTSHTVHNLQAPSVEAAA